MAAVDLTTSAVIRRTYGRYSRRPQLIAIDQFRAFCQDGGIAPSTLRQHHSTVQQPGPPLSDTLDNGRKRSLRQSGLAGERRRRLFEWHNLETDAVVTDDPPDIPPITPERNTHKHEARALLQQFPDVHTQARLQCLHQPPRDEESLSQSSAQVQQLDLGYDDHTHDSKESHQAETRQARRTVLDELSKRSICLRPRRSMQDALQILGDGYEADEIIVHRNATTNLHKKSRKSHRTPLPRMRPLQLFQPSSQYAKHEQGRDHDLTATDFMLHQAEHGVFHESSVEYRIEDGALCNKPCTRTLWSPWTPHSTPASSMYFADVSLA